MKQAAQDILRHYYDQTNETPAMKQELTTIACRHVQHFNYQKFREWVEPSSISQNNRSFTNNLGEDPQAASGSTALRNLQNARQVSLSQNR